MATLDSPTAPVVSAAVDPTFQALRTSLRPLDFKSLDGSRIGGHYAAAAFTTALLFGSSAILFTGRWTDPNNLCIPIRLTVTAAVAAAVTAQRMDPLQLSVMRAYSVADPTGSTAISGISSGNSSKMRSNMPSPQLVLQSTNAAAGISGGTKTQDNQPIGLASMSGFGAIAGLGTGLPTTELYNIANAKHPLVLANQEGFGIIWGTTALASGTMVVGMCLEWAEVPGY